MRTEIEREQQEREYERKEFLRATVALQTPGTLLILLGVGVGLIGNATTC